MSVHVAFVLCVIFACHHVSSRRVVGRFSTAAGHPEHQRDGSRLEDFSSVLPAIGWGVAPVFRTFTVPICALTPASVDVVTSPSTAAIAPETTVYTNFDDFSASLHLSLNPVTTSLIGLGAGQTIPQIEGKFAGAFQSGQSVLHVKYFHPVRQMTMKDVSSACVNEELRELIKQMVDGGQVSRNLDKYLDTHGTKVVRAATFGGRLDIFRVQQTRKQADYADVDLSFLDLKGAARLSHSDMEMHISVIGGDWTAMESDPADIEQGSLGAAIAAWDASVKAGNNLAVLSAVTLSINVLFPPELQNMVTNGIKDLGDRHVQMVDKLDELSDLKRELGTAQQAIAFAPHVSMESTCANIFPVQTSLKKLRQVEQLEKFAGDLNHFCNTAVSYSTLFENLLVTYPGSVHPSVFLASCSGSKRFMCEGASAELTKLKDTVPQACPNDGMWHRAEDVIQLLNRGIEIIASRCSLIEKLLEVH